MSSEAQAAFRKALKFWLGLLLAVLLAALLLRTAAGSPGAGARRQTPGGVSYKR